MLINFFLAFKTYYPLLRAKWVVGAVIVAIPIYRRFRTLEGKIEAVHSPFVKSS